MIEDKAVNELSVTSSVMKDSEIENNSDDTKSLIMKEQEQDKSIIHTNIERPSRKETSVLQNTVNKDTSVKDIMDFQSNIEDNLNQVPPVPSTYVEFCVGWKKIKSDPQLSYLYLKVR